MRLSLTPARFRQVAVVALVMLAVIIVSGSAVRLTGSGLGCDDWPRCSATSFVDVSSKHTAIEQINRLFTGVVGAAVCACVLAAMWRMPRRRDLIVLAWLLVLGVAANAVLGGISVKVDLHPLAVQGHMLLSMGLIVAGAVLVRRSGEPDGVPRRPTVSAPTLLLARAHFAVTSVAILSGTVVTAAGPHAGDEHAERLDVAIGSAARVHGTAVIAAVALALALAWRTRVDRDARTALGSTLSTWVFVACLQGAVGYIQYFNGVPALLVGIHVGGATAVMFLTTWLLLDTRRATAPAPADVRDARAAVAEQPVATLT